MTEIKTVIGLPYIAGVKHGNESWRILGTGGNGPPIYSEVMGINPFSFLLKGLSFIGIHSREGRRKPDETTAVRDFFEDFVRNCQRAYSVGEYTTLV